MLIFYPRRGGRQHIKESCTVRKQAAAQEEYSGNEQRERLIAEVSLSPAYPSSATDPETVRRRGFRVRARRQH